MLQVVRYHTGSVDGVRTWPGRMPRLSCADHISCAVQAVPLDRNSLLSHISRLN